jgi:hypothetical protein
VGQELGDSNGLIDVALWGFKHWEFAGDTFFLDSSEALLRNNDQLNRLAILQSNCTAELRQVVMEVVSVDFLQ